MIHYGMKNGEMRVYLDGRHIGAIRMHGNGYRYKPKGSNVAGETFMSVAAVKRSIEEA